MEIYILELALILLLGILKSTKKISNKSFVILAMIILTIVLGFRGEGVGEDTKHFLEIFNFTKNISFKTILTSGFSVVYNTVFGVDLSVEIGYMLLNKIISIFTSNGQWVLITCAILTNALVGRFIYKNCESVFFAVYIYMCEAMYMQSFNLMRQFLALAIILQTYNLILEKKTAKVVVVTLMACSIHTSAFIFLGFIPLIKAKNNNKAIKTALIGMISIILAVNLLSDVITRVLPRYAGYFSNNYWGYSARGQALLWAVEFVMCLLLYLNNIKKDKLQKKDIIGISGTLIYLLFEILGMKISAFQRVALYFNIFIVFLFTTFQRMFKPRMRFFFRIGVYFVVTVAFFSAASTPYRLYHFFWQ